MPLKEWWKRKCPNCGGLLERKFTTVACGTCRARFEQHPLAVVVEVLPMIGALVAISQFAPGDVELRRVPKPLELAIFHVVGAGIAFLTVGLSFRFGPLRPSTDPQTRTTSDQLDFVRLIADTPELHVMRHFSLLAACVLVPAAYGGAGGKALVGLAFIGAVSVVVFLGMAWQVRCPSCRLRLIKRRPAAVLGMTSMSACPDCSYRPWTRVHDAPISTPTSRALLFAVYVAAFGVGVAIGWIG